MKLKLKLFIQALVDTLNGNQFKFSTKPTPIEKSFSLSLSQEIKNTNFQENKITNIQLASNKIENIVIQPQQIFSFWKIVGEPNQTNGFKEGRTLIKGTLQKDFGGGLCQLSGILYHLCLISNLKILERHNHSVDIYDEQSRFTPLGADATVVYGYKDLRFVNPFDFPISFNFTLTLNQLIVTIKSPKPIQTQKVSFTKKEMQSTIDVLTLNEKGNVMAKSSYKKPTPKTIQPNHNNKPTIPAILTNLLSGVFILSGIIYFLFTGLFEFILHAFTESIGSFFMGLGLTLLIVLFIAGSIMNITEGIRKIKQRQNTPEATSIKPFYWSLFLGTFPFIFAISFGMIDFYVVKINEIMLLPMLIVVFSPIMFAKRLNSTIINVFYGTLFWFTLAFIGFYFFR